MDFDKTNLLTSIIDARRTNNNEYLTWLLLRFFSCDANRVYIPGGFAVDMANLAEITSRTVRRYIEGLIDRTILLKLDEKTLQLNDQFSSKTRNVISYTGSRLVMSDDENAFIFFLVAKRAEIMATLGKNKRYYKKKGEEMTLANLIKQLDVKDAQLEVKDKQIAELMAMMTAKYPKEEIKTKLAVILPFTGKEPVRL